MRASTRATSHHHRHPLHRPGIAPDPRRGRPRGDRRRRHHEPGGGQPRDRSSSHPPPWRWAARRCATWQASAAICSPARPMAISPPRSGARRNRSPGRRREPARGAARRLPARALGPGAAPGGGGRFGAPAAVAGAFRFEKLTRVKPHGASVIAIAAHLPQSGGRMHGARRLLRHGAGPRPGAGGGAGAGGQEPGRERDRRRARGRGGRPRSSDRRDRLHLVSPRGGAGLLKRLLLGSRHEVT
jgi:hypothetical protein